MNNGKNREKSWISRFLSISPSNNFDKSESLDLEENNYNSLHSDKEKSYKI